MNRRFLQILIVTVSLCAVHRIVWVSTAPADNRSAEFASDPIAQPAHAAATGEAVRDITFDNIKFEMKKGDPFKREMLTDEIKKLDGKLIRIRGYILPSFQQSGIKQFVLVRDNMECCFGPGAALYDCVLVEMIGDATTDFSVRPITVEGTFAIRELVGPGGNHLAIYHLDGRSVK